MEEESGREAVEGGWESGSRAGGVRETNLEEEFGVESYEKSLGAKAGTRMWERNLLDEFGRRMGKQMREEDVGETGKGTFQKGPGSRDVGGPP